MHHFADELYQKAQQDSFFQGFLLVRADMNEPVPFPVEQPVISFGSEQTDRMHFLLGYDLLETEGEKTIVTVLCGEASGGAFCEACARDVCMKITEMDTQKKIVSIAVDRCVHVPTAFACKVKMTFGLRESAVSAGRSD